MSDVEKDRPAGRWTEQELTALAANETSFALYITDEKANLIYVNRKFTEMFGYEPEEVIGRRGRDVLGTPHYKESDYKRLWANLMRGHEVREEVRSLDKFGGEVWLTLTVRPLFNPDGSFKHLVGIMEDTTENRQVQALQRDVLEAVAHERPLAEVMDLICRRVETIFPEVVSSILAVDEALHLHPLAAPSLPAFYSEAIEGLPAGPCAGSCGTAAWRGEAVTVEDIDADPLWADYKGLVLPLDLHACWSSPIKLRNGRVAGTFAFYFREKRGPGSSHERIVAACVQLCMLALERHESQERIARLAYYDTLTGLPNRSMLRRDLDAAFAADPAQPRAFLFLDIDRFKDVNDTLGHSVGDELLVDVATRLQKQLRPGDVICRHGGDEFVVVLHGCDPDTAAAIAERVHGALVEPTRIPGLSVPVTASIGISLYPRDGRDADTLLKNADTAMYQAKAEGRARHQFFSAEMNQLAQDRLLLSSALREAIAERRLQLRYQPQVSALDGSIVGVEALARWSHPQFGEVSPDRFIKLAEELGLIEAIGEWALDEGCRQLTAWDRAGVPVPSMSVNISPLHFRTRDLCSVVIGALDRHGLAPDRLAVEITEGVIMDDCAIATENARALRAHGVRLSMDDFGTGYSSLSHLARLPVNELKIDRSFMQGLEDNHNARTLVTAVIRIGQSLGLQVVAEGVETDAQRRFLQALDCDVLQGFLFSKALPADELARWALAHAGQQDIRGAA
jgi:diguanylate cyclase (GGDEF)-like protein/PAS domain S-box-containing protein